MVVTRCRDGVTSYNGFIPSTVVPRWSAVSPPANPHTAYYILRSSSRQRIPLSSLRHPSLSRSALRSYY